MIEWHFWEKVTRSWVVLLIGPGKEFEAQLKDFGYKELDNMDYKGHAGAVVELTPENTNCEQNCTAVWLEEWSTATLVHELAHLVMFEFRRCNIPISLDNTETFAFYLEFWFSEITRAYRRQPKGRTSVEARQSKSR